MDFLSVFKSDNQKEYLTIIFPGALAGWPFATLLLKTNVLPIESIKFEWAFIPGLILYLFFSWAVGMFISDLGSNLELRLERMFWTIKCSPKENNRASPFSFFDLIVGLIRIPLTLPLVPWRRSWEFLFGQYVEDRLDPSEEIPQFQKFYQTWNDYLMLTIPSSAEPIIDGYYKGFLTRLKFELNTFCSIVIMLLGQLLLFVFHFSKIGHQINIGETCVYVGILWCILCKLLIEAFKGIEGLGYMRQNLVEQYGSKKTIEL